MKIQLYETKYDGRIFRIFNDHSKPQASLYIYDNDYTLIPQEPIRLSSPSTLDVCKEQASKLFKVPFNGWQVSKLKRFEAAHNEYEMTIEEDMPEVGSYMYITVNGVPSYDYLQDNITMCKEFALEGFGMPLENWVEMKIF